MGFTETLRLLVEADTRGAVRNVENLGKSADREFSRAKTSADKWGSGLTKVGTGMMTVGAVALAGLGAAAKASEEANLSVVQLENTLANMPQLAGENKQQFLDLADAIQDKTAADGDAIVSGMAMLGTFRVTADQIKGLMPLVVDYAQKFGIDIPQAAMMVGKAIDGQVGALKRNGVSIDEVMFKTDRYGAIQKALSEQVGGFAEAEGKTFAGSLQRMKNQLGDLVEGVGGGAVDAFGDLAGGVTFVTDRLNDLSPAATSTIGKVATFGAVAMVAAGGVTTLAGQILKSKEGILTLINAGSSLIDGLGGIKGAALGAAGAAGIGALIFAAKELEASNQAKVLDEMAEGFAAVDFAATEASMSAIRNIDAIGLLDEAFQRAEDSGGDASTQLIDLAEKAGVSKDTISHFREEIAQHAAAMDNAKGSQESFTEGTEEMTDAELASAAAHKEAEDALKSYMDELNGTFDPLFAMADAMRDNQQAQADLNAAQLEAVAAEGEMRKQIRLHGEDSKAGREASMAYMDAQNKVSDALINARGSVVDLQGAAAQLRFEIDENGLSVSAARTQFIRMATQMGHTRKDAEAMADTFGLADDEATRLTRPRKPINIQTSGTDTARRRIREVKDGLDSLHDRTVNIHFAATGLNAIAIANSKLLSGQRARGGPVLGNRLYEVAEGDKHELFESQGHTYLIPGADGKVIPTVGAGTMPMPGGMGGGGGMSGKLKVVVEDNRTAVYINDSEIASATRRDNILNNGRASVRVR